MCRKLLQEQPPEMFYKKINLKNFVNFSGQGTCNFIKKQTLAQVFSCEICEIVKNAFFTEHLRWLLLKSKVNNVSKMFRKISFIYKQKRNVESEKLKKFIIDV